MPTTLQYTGQLVVVTCWCGMRHAVPQELRQRAQAERDLREDTERRLSAQKAQTTKARKRAAAALCPCCNRSFVQLRRHMETKHPGYDPAKA
jgi:DNA repair exonuclease SbcCD ATPase subunit